MKKSIIVLAVLAFLGIGSSHAQYYRIDPFASGEKMIGLDVGIGGWFGSADFLLENEYGTYAGYQATQLKRDPFNPTVGLIYKRTLENGRINWGNTYRVSMGWWHGTVEGVSTTNPSKTFTTDFKYRNVQLTDLYYAMIPVGDQININVGGGLSLGFNLSPTSTITFSDGTPQVETEGGMDFMDMMTAHIDFMVGADYLISDDFSLSVNFIGYPIDFFGLMDEEGKKGLRGVGEGLYVSKKFPFQLTFGFTYHL